MQAFSCPLCHKVFHVQDVDIGHDVICPHCNAVTHVPDLHALAVNVQQWRQPKMVPNGPELHFVQVADDGQITVRWNGAAEARAAIKELRAAKRYLMLQKKLVKEHMRQIRAQFTSMRRRQGSMLRGGGTIGRVVRTVQGVARDAERAQLANALAPAETKRTRLEAGIAAIDALILDVQMHELHST
jgi:hypothetical protein